MSTPPDTGGTIYPCSSNPKCAWLVMSRDPVTIPGVRGHRFWLLDEPGRVIEELEPSFACDCEYSFHTVYELRDGTLFRFRGKENDMSTQQLRKWTAEVVCDVAHEIDRDDPRAGQIQGMLSPSGR